MVAKRLVERRTRTSSRMNGLRTMPSPCSPESAPPNSSTSSATSLAMASNCRTPVLGLQVDHRPHVQAADRGVGVDAGRGAVARDECEETLDVVAQLLRRDRRVLDERKRLRVPLHRHRQPERRPRAGSRCAPARPGRGMVADSAKWDPQTFARLDPRLRPRPRLRFDEAQTHGLRQPRGWHDQGRGDPRHRQPLRAGQHAACPPPEQRPPREGAVQARRRLHGRPRRGEDRRRVHRPCPGGPALLRGPAPGDRGEGRCARPRGEPDACHDHHPELLPHVREARRA